MSFSKVTVADLGASASPDSAVRLKLEIFPLCLVSLLVDDRQECKSFDDIRINIPETEEIADFLLGSGRGNALDVNNVASRHDCLFDW